MKKILGLDLGTNSIGWALIEKSESGGRIIKAGSRIIPMDASELSDFANGNTKSKTSERTQNRIARRMRERFLLRRERLHRILKIIGYLPKHYEERIGWDIDNDKKHFGTFLDGDEPKINWRPNAEGKNEFLFKESFNEMIKDIKAKNPDLKSIPYDWTLYFIRHKALREPISKEELAWVILNFNQKRGYNQLRDEVLDTQDEKKSEYKRLIVKSVTPDENAKGKDIWYTITFENSDIIYRRKSKYPLDWVGKVRDLIITTKIDKDGNPVKKKNGETDYSIKSPSDSDWGLQKIRTEQEIEQAGLTVGQFIYNTLLNNPSQKIRGGLVRVIERDFYKHELKLILQKQSEFHPELKDRKLYDECIQELYRNNISHRNSIKSNDFIYLFLEDVLFYQRPLRTKKFLIDNCPYEYHNGLDKETGEIIKYPNKCIAKSNPFYQEYRVLCFISNLRIIANTFEKDGHILSDVDVTDTFITDKEKLFKWLNSRGEIDQSSLLQYVGIKKKEQSKFHWNYVEDKKYPMNKTQHAIRTRITEEVELSNSLLYDLWNLLYSTKTKTEIDKSLSPSQKSEDSIYQRLIKEGVSKNDIEKIKNIKLSDEGYGAYSEKAIKKILSLMRFGSYWSTDKISDSTKERINQFLNGNNIDNFPEKVWKRIKSIASIYDFQGLPEWLACYVIYGTHSEATDFQIWETPHDIDVYLNNFKQHSLRNPIVESVILETLRVVRDLLGKYGKFDEIHVELGREIKNPADKRARITQKILENENTNLRIKALISEFVNEEFHISNVRPFSPSQQEILKIYEDAVLNNYEPEDEIKDIIRDLSNPTKQPSKSAVLRYKCWLDQKYISPYTGRTIPLSQLFTSDYEIEHIIPQSIYFDDSFSNKVICETEVNKLKDNRLVYNFIKEFHGYTLPNGIRILEVEEYEQHVKNIYSSRNSEAKRKRLLMDEIPTDFIERQLNDSRYISKVIKSLLSNLVREKDENGNFENEAISKNIVVCSGKITSTLKRDWGLNDVWNSIILPRFKRLNELTGRSCFTTLNQHGDEIPSMPLEMQRGFNPKRIDHRHHALDAIIIACTTREHVNLLNNEASLPQNKEMKYALSHKLRRYQKELVNGTMRNVPKEFIMPWATFKYDCAEAIKSIVVSFKRNIRVLNKATNKYKAFNEDGKKTIREQKGEEHYAIRKPLHKATVYGHVNLRLIKTVGLKEAIKLPERIVDKEIKRKVKELKRNKFSDKQIFEFFKNNAYTFKQINLKKIEVYQFTDESTPLVATRYGNDIVSIFSGKLKRIDIEKVINKITDTGIRKILINYLEENKDDIEFAFSAEGIETLNSNITKYNNGKRHKPIKKVRLFETLGGKFSVGESLGKQKKYAEAAKGTNLFFGIYINDDGKRSYSTIPLNEVLERLKQKLSPVPKININGDKLLFYISPGDLVYVSENEEKLDDREQLDSNNIYRLISCTENEAHFIPANISNPILQTIELGSNNKAQRAWSGKMIKETCMPLTINRIGDYILK